MKSFRTANKGSISFSISPNSPCPCGSNKRANQCCISNSVLHKTHTFTTPPPPRTSKAIDGCYAASLADCGRKISREHYISEALLKHLNVSGNLTVGGYPWLNGKDKILSPNALASKVLCDRHNSSLSVLDGNSVKLFKAFDEGDAISSKQELLHLFNGHDFERWLLKTLCGFSASNNFDLEVKTDTSIPKLWLDILFGNKEFPDELGLYVCKSINHLFQGPTGIAARAISAHGRLTGLGFFICGYEFILSMSGFPNRRFDGREFVYRPFEFHTSGDEFEKSVIFSWDGKADLGTIYFKIR